MNAWATKRQIASVFYENLAKTKKGEPAFRGQFEPDGFAAQFVFAVAGLQDARAVLFRDVQKGVPVEDINVYD
jgi:hypothetical protein